MEMEYSVEPHRKILKTGFCFGFLYYILDLGWNPTAYIKLPDGMEITDADVCVHGGITFKSDYLEISDNTFIDGNFIGWDYAHAGDYLGIFKSFSFDCSSAKKWTTKEIFKDVKEVCYQLCLIQQKNTQN